MPKKERKGTVGEMWRERIRAGKILAKLMKHVEGEVEMSATQIRAAEILLKKVLPDLSSIEHKGNVEHRHLTEYSDAELIGFLERAHRRELGGGVAAETGSTGIALVVHDVYDPELESLESPPLDS